MLFWRFAGDGSRFVKGWRSPKEPASEGRVVEKGSEAAESLRQSVDGVEVVDRGGAT